MASKHYNFKKSQELYARACKVIPSGLYGHQGPAEGCWIPPTSWPFFTERAPGKKTGGSRSHPVQLP